MLLLGNDLLPWLVLAIGGALAVGNGLALLRPRPTDQDREGELERAPVARSLLMVAVGGVAAIWALASLLAS